LVYFSNYCRIFAVLISYSGPLIIFFQAAQKANISTEMMISWIWGISIGAAVAGIYLSIRYKTLSSQHGQLLVRHYWFISKYLFE
jgi:predicted benzoate:H+ symporter BenE